MGNEVKLLCPRRNLITNQNMRSLIALLLAGLLILSATAPVSGFATVSTSGEPSSTEITQSQTDVSSATPSSADISPAKSVTEDASLATSSTDDACAPLSNESERSNPSEDVLGWENGCWYNESIAVDRTDGLNQTEMDAVIARSMARVEVIRELEFKSTVPVDILTREEYKNQTSDRYANTSESKRFHENVRWEAMLMTNESTDAIAVQESNSGSTVGGYYSPAEGRIVIISENESTPKMNEIVLSQELFHALQQDYFNISEFDRSTQELTNAKGGIIEGDGNLVDHWYGQRCRSEWDCLMPNRTPEDNENVSFHWGMYLVSYQPYSDGPKFVKNLYEEKGWGAVNDMYDNPPASSEQVIHPKKYPNETPRNMSFTDKSNEKWHIPDMGENTIDYASLGEPGLASMLFYPYYDSGREDAPVIPPAGFLNISNSGEINTFDPVRYGNTPYTAGWDGDRLYPYVTDDSAETGETGYVWKLGWDSEKDAKEFVEGYLKLLRYHNATAVDGREDTYRIAEGEKFADAFYINQTGDTVYIVNAPTVDELRDVRASAGPGTVRTTKTTTETVKTTTETEQSTSSSSESTTTSGTSEEVPGFGALAALVALIGATLLVRRRL